MGRGWGNETVRTSCTGHQGTNENAEPHTCDAGHPLRKRNDDNVDHIIKYRN